MRPTRQVWIAVLAGVLGATALVPAAERPRVLDKESFMEMEGIASPAISPDAKQIVFAREWVDQIKDQSRTNLWVYDLATGRLRELTRGAWRDTSPV
jgi:Tol biopolymer transport system component